MTHRDDRRWLAGNLGAVMVASCAAVGVVACAPPRAKIEGPTHTLRASDAAGEPARSSDGSVTPQVSAGVLSTETWSFATAEGQVIRTPNYRVFTTADSQILRDRLALFAEHALVHYRTAIAPLPAPTQRLDTYLMRNRPQWEALTKQLMGEQAEMLVKIPRGGYASRGIGVYYDIGTFDTLAIAGHEGWHQYTQRVFQQQLPVWLEEGIATFMEGHRWEGNTPVFRPWANVQRFDQLRAAAQKGGFLPLAELLESRPQDFLDFSDDRVLTFYAQLWALAHFLNEGAGGKYRASLGALLMDAAEGRTREVVSDRVGERAATSQIVSRTGPGLFLAYFNQNLDEASVEYDAFLRTLVSTGSRNAIVDGRSPVSGLVR